MSTTLYDGARRILKALIIEFRRENMSDGDIADSIEHAKKIINRVPIITKNAKESLSKAIDDTTKELNKKK